MERRERLVRAMPEPAPRLDLPEIRYWRTHVHYGSGEPIAMPYLRTRGERDDIQRVDDVGWVGISDLRHKDLRFTFWNECDFSHPSVKLRGADFSHCQFVNCDVTGKGLELLGCVFTLDCLSFEGLVSRDETDHWSLVWLVAQCKSPASEKIMGMIPRPIRARIERYVTSLRHQMERLR